MTTNDDRNYYAGRAEYARTLADKAELPEVRKIHLEMAGHYSRLSELGRVDRSILSIVTAKG